MKLKPKIKALVLLSGGLDSRLAAKIMQEQLGKNVVCMYFSLPFGSGCCNEHCALKFSQTEGIKTIIIDCTKEKNFQEYISMIRKPKFGYGSGINPCIDCRIFMLKKAKEYADKNKIELIVTGEVIGERPMSQHRGAMDIVEEESGLKGRLLRPLSAKLLPETEAEKKELVDRSRFFSVSGRGRKKQFELADKYKISYPTPGGGCLLCEQVLSARLRDLFKHNKEISEEDIELLKLGRHFRNKSQIIAGRNQKENDKLETIGKKLKFFLLEPEVVMGPSVIYESKDDKALASEILASYSDAEDGEEIEVRQGKEKIKVKKKDRSEFEKYRI